MDTAEVIVVGAGVNGASAAFHLAQAGAGRVVVFDKGYLASGATGKSGAMIRMHYTNPHEASLARESLHYFQQWPDIVGGDCGFRTTGFMLFVEPQYRSDLESNIAMLRGLGVNTRLISPEEAHELDRDLFLDDVTHIAYEPESGYADPSATTYTLVEAAQRLGVEFRLDTEVMGLLHQDQKIVGVETRTGQVHAGQVLVAAGAWANKLFHPIGIDLGLIPAVIRVAIFRWPAGRYPAHPISIDRINESWFRPYEANCTLAGTSFAYNRYQLTDPYPTDSYDVAPAEFVNDARAHLAARMPIMQNGALRGSWACVYMRSPDDHLVIGQLEPYEGLYCFTGDNGGAFKTAPAIGKCLAELMTEGSARTVDLTPFRPSRFAEGLPWRHPNNYCQDPNAPLC